jgi:tetratricopeptide (TPR) repeat protein
MVTGWSTLVFQTLKSVSSDPDNFGRNFISTFNPSSLETRDREEMILERGEARLNPERAERYYLSGIRYLDQRKFANAQVDLKIAIQSNPGDAKLHYHLARAFLGMGQLRQAESSLRQTLEREPEHVQAMLLLSELVQSQENPTEARELAARALEIEPDNLQAIRLNAGQLANLRDTEAVRPLLDTLLARDGENPDIMSFAARLELGLFEQPEAARELLDNALEINPDHIPSKLEMINLHLQNQNIEMVEQTLNEVLELDPDHLQALRLRAEMNLNRFGILAGIREYEQLLDRFGGNLQFRLRYAELLLRAGRVSEAKELAQQLTDSRVRGIERSAHWLLAQMYAQARMFDNAIEHGQGTLRLSPDQPGIHVFLAQNFLNLRQFREAKREAERALALNPLNGQAINLLTQSMRQLDQHAEAIDLLDELLAEYPDEDALKLLRVEILLQSPEWRDAIPYTRDLLETYPDNPSLKNNLAFLLARSGQDLDQALSLVNDLPEDIQENPVIMDTRAYVLAALGRHEEAIPLFEQALSQAGGNVTIRFHYALSLNALGRTEEAARQVQAALMINPDFPQAGEARILMESLTSSET